MHHIHLDDRLFREVQRRAADAGFDRVDDYVADVLEHGFQEPPEQFDFLFTSQRLAEIDRAAAEIDAGQGLTREQVEAELARSRAEWLDQNQR